MAFNVNVTNSCKTLVIHGNQYDPASTQATLVFTDMDNNSSYTAIMTYTAGIGKINVPVSNLPSLNGVFRVCLSENGIEYSCVPVLIKCDIDCCLTKLTNELIDCSCDCPRCSTALAKAQKIFLLLQSAASAVEIAAENPSSGYFEDIYSKYIKAREICDNSCGCDC
jgi:hypothetical protein|tara:strand:- start:145 stop:645 length:501 start_codon:yes stop_codon:yes gene_type:complete